MSILIFGKNGWIGGKLIALLQGEWVNNLVSRCEKEIILRVNSSFGLSVIVNKLFKQYGLLSSCSFVVTFTLDLERSKLLRA